jgi:hypothetical protein
MSEIFDYRKSGLVYYVEFHVVFMLSMVVVAIFSKTVQQLLYNHGTQNIEADSNI